VDPTGTALLAAVAAHPDEDTPRLIYADYLDELGDERSCARAEFIRLQVMISGAEPETDEASAARARAAELLARYGRAWGLPPAGGFPGYEVSRGFVDTLSVDLPGPAAWTEILRLLGIEPVGRLRVARPYTGWGWSAGAADWLDVPALGRVRHLELSGPYWADREVARFLAFAHFPALLTLTLTRVPITGAGIAALADCARLSDLVCLRINDTKQWSNELREWTGGVPTPGVRALASSVRLAGLRTLSLRSAGIETAGAFALADSRYLSGLTAACSLDLAENPGIGPAGRAALLSRFGGAVTLSPARN
jgi:uncharacterized protein (TIGR02996 family)